MLMLEFTTAETVANGRKRTLEKGEFVILHLRAVHVFYPVTCSQLLCLHGSPTRYIASSESKRQSNQSIRAKAAQSNHKANLKPYVPWALNSPR